MALLSVQNVSKTFKDHDYRVHAVRNASLEVHRGEMIAIIGPSGSGKTTLLNLMGIVVAPDSGEVYVDGQKASDMSDDVRCRIRNQYFGYIVQDFALIEEDTSISSSALPLSVTAVAKIWTVFPMSSSTATARCSVTPNTLRG